MLRGRRKGRIEIEGTATERDIRPLVRERAGGGNGMNIYCEIGILHCDVVICLFERRGEGGA
jgi:hypothetical protein